MSIPIAQFSTPPSPPHRGFSPLGRFGSRFGSCPAKPCMTWPASARFPHCPSCALGLTPPVARRSCLLAIAAAAVSSVLHLQGVSPIVGPLHMLFPSLCLPHFIQVSCSDLSSSLWLLLVTSPTGDAPLCPAPTLLSGSFPRIISSWG